MRVVVQPTLNMLRRSSTECRVTRDVVTSLRIMMRIKVLMPLKIRHRPPVSALAHRQNNRVRHRAAVAMGARLFVRKRRHIRARVLRRTQAAVECVDVTNIADATSEFLLELIQSWTVPGIGLHGVPRRMCRRRVHADAIQRQKLHRFQRGGIRVCPLTLKGVEKPTCHAVAGGLQLHSRRVIVATAANKEKARIAEIGCHQYFWRPCASSG